MTRIEGENTRLRHYLARLHRKTLCYSKSEEMLRYSIKLLIHYLKFGDVPTPYPNNRNYSLGQRCSRTRAARPHFSLIIP